MNLTNLVKDRLKEIIELNNSIKINDVLYSSTKNNIMLVIIRYLQYFKRYI